MAEATGHRAGCHRECQRVSHRCGTGQATGPAIIVVHGGSGEVEEGDRSEMPMKMLMSDDEKPEVGSGGDGLGSRIVEGCGLLKTQRMDAVDVECSIDVGGDDV